MSSEEHASAVNPQDATSLFNSNGTLKEDFAALEFYKLEYARGAQRFNEIYLAIWTNFSYMAVIAGGIVTFAGGLFKDNPACSGNALLPAALIAHIPLFFWYTATFLPLNEYGDDALVRLQHLECLVNKRFHLKLGHFIGVEHPHEKKSKIGKLIIILRPGVRVIVWIFFMLLLFSAMILGKTIVPNITATMLGVRSSTILLSIWCIVAWGVGVVGGSQVLRDIKKSKHACKHCKPDENKPDENSHATS